MAPSRWSATPLHFALSGASGLLGSTLAAALEARGHRITRLVRRPPGPDEIRWDPPTGQLDRNRLLGIDGVLHFAGANIARWPWTRAHKQRVRDSRTLGTRLLADSVAGLPVPPRVFLSASAVGYYGDRGDEVLQEESPPGQGFLAEVAQEWEAATTPAQAAGSRVVLLRIGLVLARGRGALPQLLFPFRFGLGGRLGSGRQWLSWIALSDVVEATVHCLDTDALQGPVNFVAPAPVTNREFATTLGRVLRRPTPFPVPAFALRLVLGEMADQLLLASQRVLPTRLEATGYRFRFPALEAALREVLGPDR